jgi:hypothetical protein
MPAATSLCQPRNRRHRQPLADELIAAVHPVSSSRRVVVIGNVLGVEREKGEQNPDPPWLPLTRAAGGAVRAQQPWFAEFDLG